MKKIFEEFRGFIAKDNIVTLTVAVILGGSFSSIVTSLVNDIFMPILVAVTGQATVSGISLRIGNTYLAVGNFLQAVINFVIIGFLLFMTLKALGKAQGKDLINPPAPPAGPSEKDLLQDILNELKKEK